VKNRRSLTPSLGSISTPPGEVHATRRGGARRELSARVTLTGKNGEVLEGWALNVSKGGLRVILEEKVDLGAEFEVTLTSGATEANQTATPGAARAKAGTKAGSVTPAQPTPNVGRIVWVQEEPDGVVAGIEFCVEP
jgi:PilZ domain